eukprot:605203-Pelagomonas_calceolata.AAC.2
MPSAVMNNRDGMQGEEAAGNERASAKRARDDVEEGDEEEEPNEDEEQDEAMQDGKQRFKGERMHCLLTCAEVDWIGSGNQASSNAGMSNCAG